MIDDKDPGTVLVTGAGRRLGRAIALDFANRGWRVGIHYGASAAGAQDVVAEIERKGGKAAALEADLACVAALDPLMEACAEALGAPTCLINNAACFERDTLATLTADSWQAHLDVNLRAPVFLAKAFAKSLPEGKTGNVINLIDQKVLRLNPDYFSYTIAKAGLWTATQTMAQALAPRIRVNAVAPGPVLKSRGQSDAEFEREFATTLLGRQVNPDDVSAAIRFLLDTPSITGQMIALDGGQHLGWHDQN
ncbi:MAG TPA: SDR family oxidoreductase [Methyloceanibacter sp.]|nr:SDR family oxidoreductase [Methyloceanibacter sp.]